MRGVGVENGGNTPLVKGEARRSCKDELASYAQNRLDTVNG